MATLGYVRSSNGPDLAQIGANEQLVSHIGPNSPSTGNSPSGVFLAYSVSGYVGRWGGPAVMRFGGWSASSSSAAPGSLLFRTEEVTPTVNYMDGGGGQKLTGRIIDGNGSLTIVPISSSQIVALGAASRNAAAGIAMYQAQDINQPNESFYRKGISGTTLESVSGSSSSNEGQLALQLNGVYNRRPNRPGAITITAGATTRTPTFRASFSDPDETINGVSYDRLETYRMEVWWSGTRRHNGIYTASTAERNGRYSQRQCPVSIPYDTPYTVFFYHRDRAGAESEGRSFSGTIFSGAAVDPPTSPTGFITNPVNPGGITAVYRSSGGLNANAVRVRLVNASGSPIQTSAILSRTVAPNASTTVTWAQSGFGTQPNGVTRGVQMQARDSNGTWSGWSGIIYFRTNAAPDVPIITSPTNNAASSSLPNLRATGNDDDGNNGVRNVGMGLYTEILDESDNVLGTYAAGWNDWVNGLWVLTPDKYSGDIPGYGTYKHRWYAYDGYLYSGGSTTAAGATRSAPRSFIYAAVPSVTVIEPAGPVVGTMQPMFVWIASGQNRYRVRGYSLDNELVYDTGEVTSSSPYHIISADQHWIGGEKWNRDETFEWVVSVRDSSTLWGDSDPLSLTLEYDPIDVLTITGEARSYPGIDGTHYNRIETSVTTYDEEDFVGYHRRRVAITGPFGEEIEGTEVVLPTGRNAGDPVFEDYYVVSNQWYRYYVWQEIQVGNDVVPSDEVSVDLMSSWYGTILFSNADPTRPVWLRYGGVGGRYEPTVSNAFDRRNVRVRGRRAPKAISNGYIEVSANGEYTFLTNDESTTAEQLANLYRINDWQSKQVAPNGRPNGITFREGRGGPRGLLHVTMNIDSFPAAPRADSVNLAFEEYDYNPFAEVLE